MKKLVAAILSLCLLLSCVSVAGAEATGYTDVLDLNLMVAAKSNHGDWNEFWVLDTIEKYCGIRFHVTQVSEDGWQEKKNLAFATDVLPDVFLNDLTDEDLANYGSQGYLLPLEQYMTKEMMPNMYEVMENEGFPDLIKGMTFPDGHVYNIHGVNGSLREYAKSRYFINTQWAENLGVKIPTTLDEFYDYLVAVRDGDADLDGDPNNEIPISGVYGKYTDHFAPILVAFGFLEKRLQADENGNVFFVPAHENYKEFLKFMHKLYAEGLLDSTYFTQTSDQYSAKEASGVVASFTDYASWLNNSDPAFYMQYSSVEPYTSEYNTEKMWPAKEAIYYGGLSITSNLEGNEEAIQRLIKFVDWCYSAQGTELLWRGYALGSWEEYPGTGYYFVPLDEDNLGYLVRKWAYPTDDYASAAAWQTAKVKPENNYWPYATIPSRDDNANPASTSYNLSYNINTFCAPYYKVGYPSTLKYTSEENDEMGLISTDLENCIATYESKMIIGDLDIDTGFEEMVKTMEGYGLARYVELAQQAYDRYSGK